MAKKLPPSWNNSASCTQRDPGNEGYGDITKQGAVKRKGEMNNKHNSQLRPTEMVQKLGFS